MVRKSPRFAKWLVPCRVGLNERARDQRQPPGGRYGPGVDGIQVSRWFAEYLDAFAACGRGERDTATLLDFYAVPLLVTTDEGFFVLTSGEQVVATAQQQVDEIRAASYGRSEIKTEKVTVLNATSALYEGTIARQRDDGGEIGRLTATYLVTEGKDGRRISVLAVHGRP
jgi:hypothetical protein